MSVRDIMRRWAEKNAAKKKQFKELEEDYLLKKKLGDKQKSANERELERYVEEHREARIKTELEHFRKKHKKDFWKSNLLNKSKDKSILHEDKPILKEKNIFAMKGNMFMKGNMLNSGGYFK